MKTPVTQRSPCYSAVSALLMNPLPDRSNYSPLCHTHYLTHTSLVSSGETLYQAVSWRLIQYFKVQWQCCSTLLQNLVGNSVPWRSWTTSRGKCRCSLSSSSNCNSAPFCLFSLLSAPFLNPLSSPSPPSLLSLLCLPKIISLHSVSPMAHFFAFCFTPWHFCNNAFYKLVKTKFWCLSSTLRTWRN